MMSETKKLSNSHNMFGYLFMLITAGFIVAFVYFASYINSDTLEKGLNEGLTMKRTELASYSTKYDLRTNSEQRDKAFPLTDEMKNNESFMFFNDLFKTDLGAGNNKLYSVEGTDGKAYTVELDRKNLPVQAQEK